MVPPMNRRGYGMVRIWGALALAMLAGCGDGGDDYPKLMPTDQVLAPPALPGHAADAARDPTSVSDALNARSQALAGRAGVTPVANDADLQRRADALRARARALSQQSLSADCPEGSPNCPPN